MGNHGELLIQGNWQMDDRFRKAVEKVLSVEGGHSNDPKDSGGETKFGISKKSYPTLDIKNLTREEAVDLYWRDFWLMYHYDKILDEKIAEKVFSFCVNMGPMRAHVLLQIALNFTGKHVSVDGHLGPKTLEAINGHSNPAWLLATYQIQAAKFYLKLNSSRYEKGWIARALA